MELIFHDGSLQPYANHRAATLERMRHLVLVLREAPTYGLSRILRTDRFFHAIELEPGYHLYQWLNDRNVPREEHQFVLQLVTKSPFLEDMPLGEVDEQTMSISYHGIEYASLFAAFTLDFPTVSLCHGEWDKSQFDVICSKLQLSGDITAADQVIRNVARSEHYGIHAHWISDRNRNSICDGGQLCADQPRLLDKLIFCTGVQKQLVPLNRSDANFAHIVDRLFDLQEYCIVWNSGGFQPGALRTRCNPTSPETLKRYEVDYTFLLPNATPIICGWHFYLPQNAWRMYFAPDAVQRRIIVGYVGKHLPTKTKYT